MNVAYDALDRAVEQNRTGVYTQIVYSPAGQKLALMQGLSTLESAFVALPGGGAAVYTGSGGLAYYKHADGLGTQGFASYPNQTLDYDVAAAPFGQTYGASPSGAAQNLSFTGMNQDTVSGLYDFLYREYNPNEGRWASPDPAGLAAANPADLRFQESVGLHRSPDTGPQTWNRYAYVRNSPLEAADPNGLWCVWDGSGHDDDPEDGGVDAAGCAAQGGYWDPTDTIVGLTWTPGGLVGWTALGNANAPTIYFKDAGNSGWISYDPNTFASAFCRGACTTDQLQQLTQAGINPSNPGFLIALLAQRASAMNQFIGAFALAGPAVAVGGWGALEYGPAALEWGLANPIPTGTCALGAAAAAAGQGPLPLGITGPYGSACGAAVKGGEWIYNKMNQ